MPNGPRWFARNQYWWADMVGGPNWLIYEEDEGVISAGENIELEVTVAPIELEDGIYRVWMDFETMDPESEFITIPILLSVSSPVYSVSGVVTDEDGGAEVEDVTISTDPFDMRRISD